MRITPTKDKVGGFELPPEGIWEATVQVVEETFRNEEERAEFDALSPAERKKTPVNRIRVQFALLEGEGEGLPVSHFFSLRGRKGMADLLKLLYVTGIHKAIEKKYGLPSIEEGWEDNVIRSRKMLNELSTSLVGATCKVEIEHIERDDRVFANIVDFLEGGSVPPKVESGGEEGEEDEGW